jgi:hypothetical protein
MAYPTEPSERLLDWSSAGSNTDPGGSKESAGWDVSERPPAEWLNWLSNTRDSWISHLADLRTLIPRAAFRIDSPASTGGAAGSVDWSIGEGIASLAWATGNLGIEVNFDNDIISSGTQGIILGFDMTRGSVSPGISAEFTANDQITWSIYDEDTGALLDWDTDAYDGTFGFVVWGGGP